MPPSDPSADEWTCECAAGEGYRPAPEAAERLRRIDSLLGGFEGDALKRTVVAPHDEDPLMSQQALASKSGVLGEMRQQRAEADALQRIKERLNALQRMPTAEVAATEAEQKELSELLACVRCEAEQLVDSRPSIARPLTASKLPPPPPPHADIGLPAPVTNDSATGTLIENAGVR